MGQTTRAIAFALFALASLPRGAAHAQPSSDAPWLVVVAAADGADLERLSTVAQHTRDALDASDDVLPGADAAARLDRGDSIAFRRMPPALAQRLSDTASSMMRDLVRGSATRARALGEPLLSEVVPFLPAIGRDPDASRALADVCLHLVRSHLAPGASLDREAAATQALECISILPDVTPDDRHPPEVATAITTQRRSLEESLIIQSSAGDARRCTIRVNGRAVGTTPVASVALPPGHYAVQLECAADAPSRVREVHVTGGEPTSVMIDGRFDSTLRVDAESGTIALGYPTADELRERLADDVLRVGTRTGTTRVLVVVDDGTDIRIERFELAGGRAVSTATSPVAQPADAARSRRALAMLLGESLPPDTTDVSAGTPTTTHTDGLLVPSIVAFAIGGAALITFGTLGGLALAEYEKADDECGGSPPTCSESRVRPIDDLALGADIALVTGLVGVGVGAILLLVDPPREVAAPIALAPWWTPTTAGLALTGAF